MVEYEVSNDIAIITLARPEKRNALNSELVKTLKSLFDKANSDEKIRTVILTGKGKAFCSGADLEYLNKLQDFSSKENYDDSKNLAELFLQIYYSQKITVAAVNGPAIAGGCGLASVCDFVTAHKSDSKFGYSEVKIGFIPAIVSTFLLKKIGEGKATEMLLTGNVLSGNEAYEIGLVNYLYNNVLDESIEFINRLNQNSKGSVEMAKKMIKSISNLDIKTAVDLCLGLNTISRSTEDFTNGLRNFLKGSK